jgi:hypothetical protein
MKVSGITIRPPFGSRAYAATTDSSSDKSRTAAAITSTAKDEAAALRGFRKDSAYGATAGLNSIATLVTRRARVGQDELHLIRDQIGCGPALAVLRRRTDGEHWALARNQVVIKLLHRASDLSRPPARDHTRTHQATKVSEIIPSGEHIFRGDRVEFIRLDRPIID